MLPERFQDPIQTVLRGALPQAPHLVAYLHQGLVDHEATPAVAQAFVTILTEAFGSLAPVSVSEETVRRFADTSDQKGTHDIFLELVSRSSRFQPLAAALALNLRGIVRVQLGKSGNMEVRVEPHTSLPREHTIDYLRLFYRAYAMIADLPFDPRRKAA